MNLRIIVQSERSQTKESPHCTIPFVLKNLSNCKLIVTESISTVAWVRVWGEVERRNDRDARKLLVDNGRVHYFYCDVGFCDIYKTLNMCSLFYVSNTSAKEGWVLRTGRTLKARQRGVDDAEARGSFGCGKPVLEGPKPGQGILTMAPPEGWGWSPEIKKKRKSN